jgi:hypothetical protein
MARLAMSDFGQGLPTFLNGPMIDPETVVHQGTVVHQEDGGVTAEFGFQRARAGGNGRARRDDGVCLSAS